MKIVTYLIPIACTASQVRSAYAMGVNRILDTVLMMLVDFESILRENLSAKYADPRCVNGKDEHNIVGQVCSLSCAPGG